MLKIWEGSGINKHNILGDSGGDLAAQIARDRSLVGEREQFLSTWDYAIRHSLGGFMPFCKAAIGMESKE